MVMTGLTGATFREQLTTTASTLGGVNALRVTLGAGRVLARQIFCRWCGWYRKINAASVVTKSRLVAGVAGKIIFAAAGNSAIIKNRVPTTTALGGLG